MGLSPFSSHLFVSSICHCLPLYQLHQAYCANTLFSCEFRLLWLTTVSHGFRQRMLNSMCAVHTDMNAWKMLSVWLSCGSYMNVGSELNHMIAVSKSILYAYAFPIQPYDAHIISSSVCTYDMCPNYLICCLLTNRTYNNSSSNTPKGWQHHRRTFRPPRKETTKKTFRSHFGTV